MADVTIEITVIPPKPMTLRAVACAFMAWITQDIKWLARGGFKFGA